MYEFIILFIPLLPKGTNFDSPIILGLINKIILLTRLLYSNSPGKVDPASTKIFIRLYLINTSGKYPRSSFLFLPVGICSIVTPFECSLSFNLFSIFDVIKIQFESRDLELYGTLPLVSRIIFLGWCFFW